MIAIKTLKKEVAEHERLFDYYKKTKELRKYNSRVKFLKTCIYYLEDEPSEQFIQKEIDRLQNRWSVCDLALDDTNKRENIHKHRALKNEIKECKRFLKTLIFIQDKPTPKNQQS